MVKAGEFNREKTVRKTLEVYTHVMLEEKI